LEVINVPPDDLQLAGYDMIPPGDSPWDLA
jgi:hypothetical protein